MRLDRLIIGATRRMPLSGFEIEGFRVTEDFRPRRQGKFATYGRVRKFRSVGSSSLIVLQYQPLLAWLRYPCRITFIGDDRWGVILENIEAVLVHCTTHQIFLVEIAFDFALDVGVDRRFVLRHGVFGKSRRQPDPAGRGNLRYGTRASAKLVRSYRKHQLECFRVELESHGQLLRQYSISQVSNLGSFASRLYPNHIRFVGFRWNKLRRYLIRRFGLAGPRIYDEVDRRADQSLRLATRFLSDQGVANTHRFLRPLAVNDEIQFALNKWATWFSRPTAAPREHQISGMIPGNPGGKSATQKEGPSGKDEAMQRHENRKCANSGKTRDRRIRNEIQN